MESRKKQPELVRARLLKSAAEITVEKGLAGLTLDAVAVRAGVSKGGLLHHFPSRRELSAALYDELLARFENLITSCLVEDDRSEGRFSRAYLRACVALKKNESDSRLMAAMSLAMSIDEEMARRWRNWKNRRLDEAGENEGSTIGLLLRYAADGLWLEDCEAGFEPDEKKRQAVVETLLELSIHRDGAATG